MLARYSVIPLYDKLKILHKYIYIDVYYFLCQIQLVNLKVPSQKLEIIAYNVASSCATLCFHQSPEEFLDLDCDLVI